MGPVPRIPLCLCQPCLKLAEPFTCVGSSLPHCLPLSPPARSPRSPFFFQCPGGTPVVDGAPGGLLSLFCSALPPPGSARHDSPSPDSPMPSQARMASSFGGASRNGRRHLHGFGAAGVPCRATPGAPPHCTFPFLRRERITSISAATSRRDRVGRPARQTALFALLPLPTLLPVACSFSPRLSTYKIIFLAPSPLGRPAAEPPT